MNFPRTDHFREGDAKFRSAHGAGHREEHLPAVIDMLHPSLRGIESFACIEVLEVLFQESGDGHTNVWKSTNVRKT